MKLKNSGLRIVTPLVALLLVAPVTAVWGSNVVDIECDSCQTVTDFENAALSDYELAPVLRIPS